MKAILRVGLACLALQAVVTTESHAVTITVPPDPAPSSVGSDTTLNLLDGGVLPGCFQTGATLAHSSSCGLSIPATTNVTVNVLGGGVGRFHAFNGSTINISGGRFGDRFWAMEGSEVNIAGGEFDAKFLAHLGPTVQIREGVFYDGIYAMGSRFPNEIYPEWTCTQFDISGGVFGNPGDELLINKGVEFYENVKAKISGGVFNAPVTLLRNSEVSIYGGSFQHVVTSGGLHLHGGTIQGDLRAYSGAHLYGSEFALGGVPIEGLVVGEPFTILDPELDLSGLLADGSPFDFAHRYLGGELTLTLIPEPAAAALVSLAGVLSISRTQRAPLRCG